MTLRTLQPFAALALLLVPAGASPPPDDRPRATVALADLPDQSARAVLIVRAGSGRSVILLRRDDATASDLAAALALLRRTRHNDGIPTRDRQLVMRTASIARPLSDRARQRLGAQLTRLRRAPPRDLEGVGTVPAIELR